MYRAGWLQGVVGPAQLGTAGYLMETPEKRHLTEYWTRIWDGRIAEAIEYATTFGSTSSQRSGEPAGTALSGAAGLLHALGRGLPVHAAAVIGLPMGDFPHLAGPPQAILPDLAKEQIRTRSPRPGWPRSWPAPTVA